MIFLTTIEHNAWLTDNMCTICRKFTNTQHGVETTAGVGPTIH